MTTQDAPPGNRAAAAAHQLVEFLAAKGIELTTIARALVTEGAAVLAVSGADAAAIDIITTLALADTGDARNG